MRIRGYFLNYQCIVLYRQTLVEQNQFFFIATSKPTIYAERILNHFNIRQFFKNVYGSELNGARSKKGELIAYLLQQEQININQTIMIGERKHDLLGAHENNLTLIGVSYGYGSLQELSACQPSCIVDSPAKL